LWPVLKYQGEVKWASDSLPVARTEAAAGRGLSAEYLSALGGCTTLLYGKQRTATAAR
jgi:hypothetical protein